jgi:hypothetical protein
MLVVGYQGYSWVCTQGAAAALSHGQQLLVQIVFMYKLCACTNCVHVHIVHIESTCGGHTLVFNPAAPSLMYAACRCLMVAPTTWL